VGGGGLQLVSVQIINDHFSHYFPSGLHPKLHGKPYNEKYIETKVLQYCIYLEHMAQFIPRNRFLGSINV
jgi:hypothetical protein